MQKMKLNAPQCPASMSKTQHTKWRSRASTHDALHKHSRGSQTPEAVGLLEWVTLCLTTSLNGFLLQVYFGFGVCKKFFQEEYQINYPYLKNFLLLLSSFPIDFIECP